MKPDTNLPELSQDVPPVPARRRRQASAPSKGRLAVAIGLGAAAAGLAGVLLTGMEGKAVYVKPVDELLAQRARFMSRPIRVDGNLVHGSLQRREQPCEYRFKITKNGAELPVRYAQCIVPDTFRDVPETDVGVTVEGELKPDSTFEATTVMAKCPSKYEMKQKQEKGETMPHAETAAR